MNFNEFFEKAAENDPLPFQRKFAEATSVPQFVRVPTGMGKTAMAVVGWLWRRFGASEERRAATPRRLVYCLPMRVLVEQTAANARKWIGNLKAAKVIEGDGPAVYVLMGGENQEEWDIHPEREAILVGTQDMLLSRALNRGYAATRARWPIQFGMLHSDCLWVFDEIQLMGAGLATAAQLEAFRRFFGDKDGQGCRSVWMSATFDKRWLETVDFKQFVENEPEFRFDFENEMKDPTLCNDARNTLEVRWTAAKPLKRAEADLGDAKKLAAEIFVTHKSGTRTIIVVNTVRRSCEMFEALKGAKNDERKKVSKRKEPQNLVRDADQPSAAKPGIVVLHSRFRSDDRQKHLDDALADIPDGPGTIVVSTQVIEAGVDVSATTLFTELAPWASLVQRFGRCNRKGEANEHAAVRWIEVPDEETAPYDVGDLKVARKGLIELEKKGVGLAQLDAYIEELSDDEKKRLFEFEQSQVIRRKDLIDLFDTTPDLAGNDIDIDRFVRDIEKSDVRVFWRAWDQGQSQAPSEDQRAPLREELCPARIGEFKDFVKDPKRKGKVWRWSFLEKKWESADAGKIAPGQVYLVHADAGGYSTERGWDPNSEDPVKPINPAVGMKGEAQDASDADQLSQIPVWQTIAEHVDEVCTELKAIVKALLIGDFEAQAMRHAARWHDRGKAHEVFQTALPDGVPDNAKVWAKAKGTWKRYTRKHFRHELASALAVLDPSNDKIPDALRDLAAYLVAAHHGKVRLSIRSLPNERHPSPRSIGIGNDRRFARGIWDGDELPETDLGGGENAPAVTLSLEPMELGLCAEPPFANLPSWAERMIRLRDTLGPFRLAYLEAIVRAADMRASGKAERREGAAANRETASG
ncbi:MAG: type I-G CRISPR-associated helicase/endonuclease Cas3g [Candidatus Binataceae bacterium]